MDIYLKAADEDTLKAALIAAGVAVEYPEETVVYPERTQTYLNEETGEEIVEVIPATSFTTPAWYDAAPGFVLIKIGPLPGVVGYHANLYGEVSDERRALLPEIPKPNNPLFTLA